MSVSLLHLTKPLVASLKLADLKGSEPIMRTGQVRWFEKINKDSTYIVGLDPAMGTGGDNAAIAVWSLPELIQVGEWQNNRTDVRGQVKTMHDILTIINDEMR